MRVPSLAATALAAVAVLAGCAGSPEPLNATSAGVTYQYDGDQIDKAAELAAAHCSNFGKRAHLTNATRQSGENLAIYECI